MADQGGQSVNVEGRTLALTNLDKVLYPATGTTKGEVIAYYAEVGPWLVPHLWQRPLTRKRWPDGVGKDDGDKVNVFFAKNLPKGTPGWVKRYSIEHSDGTNDYPVANDVATLVWLAQLAALELHVPQWRFTEAGAPLPPDRLVLDLDPGQGVSLADCAEVAQWVRESLAGVGLESFPVTSGSKGIHLYTHLDGTLDPRQASELARGLAQALQSAHPDRVTAVMRRADRQGKVFLDWSQNNGNKTTITPYSLRGRTHPTVAAPRTWDELADPDLRHLEFTEVLARLRAQGDLVAPLSARPSIAGGSPTHPGPPTTPRRSPTTSGRPPAHPDSLTTPGGPPAGPRRSPATSGGPLAHSDSLTTPGGPPANPGSPEIARPTAPDRLTQYRSMRDADVTPEPVPAPGVSAPGLGNSFVVQEHHARRLHYDVRLERDGVLVSWAVPKGPPTDPKANHLAVQTEDHPLEYGTFEGTIPKGEYGGGTVTIWDAGIYELEKWREKEVIVTLRGRPDGGLGGAPARFALIKTGQNWLMHRMALAAPNAPEAGRRGSRRHTGGPAPAADGVLPTARVEAVATSGSAATPDPAATPDSTAVTDQGTAPHTATGTGPDTAPHTATVTGPDTAPYTATVTGPSTAPVSSATPDSATAPDRATTTRDPSAAPDSAAATGPGTAPYAGTTHDPSLRATPADFAPMLASLADPSSIADERAWAFEMKWDGVRVIVHIADGRARLFSRRGREDTDRYPDLVPDLLRLPVDAAVLDGEIVALDAHGAPSFGLLQPRINLTRAADIAAAARQTPVQLVLFDVLSLNGQSLIDRAYEERRLLLEALQPPAGSRVQVPPGFEGDLASALDASEALRLEGVMAKKRGSSYEPGRRSNSWRKIKHRRTQSVVVVGWRSGQGSREGTVGALLVAVPEAGRLTYAGRVGTGFTDAGLAEAHRRLTPLALPDPPLPGVPPVDARDAHWVAPVLVGEVFYAERTTTRRLRFPVWRGWRPELNADDVAWE